MAEDTNTGTAPVSPPVEQSGQPEPTQQETPQAPQESAPTPQRPAGGGSSVEQLSERMVELERLAQEAQERAARAEHDAQLAYNLRDQLGLQRGQPQENAPDAPSITDDEFLTNPAKATSKIIEGYFERERKEREREKVSQYVETARTAYERGKQAAIKANPNLYRGIEPDISREIMANIQSSLRAGQPVDSSVLGDPRYWEAAAVAMRIMNGEDVSKYYMRGHSPMAPMHTETPTVGAPPKAATTLTPEQEELVAKGNITREQFLESQAKVRAITEERSR